MGYDDTEYLIISMCDDMMIRNMGYMIRKMRYDDEDNGQDDRDVMIRSFGWNEEDRMKTCSSALVPEVLVNKVDFARRAACFICDSSIFCAKT